jgi:membrane-associated phospholipid phosphatase
LLTTLAASTLPHLLKKLFDQERPDRLTIRDTGGAFRSPAKARTHFLPVMRSISGLASAASRLPASQRNLLWGVGAGLVATRVVLLAHWVSDVAAGLAVGVFLERALRFVTGYGDSNGCEKDSSRRHL